MSKLMNTEVSIEINNLHKQFGNGELTVNAVKELTLHIAKNEIVLVMGPSGAGKSTFVQMLGGLLTPSEGEIIINNYNITKQRVVNLSNFRLKTIGFIFQSPNLIPSLTALQNIEIILNLNGIKGKKAKNKAIKLLNELNLSHRVNYKPKLLSGGEQQRVAIARALANDPQILIADEPTASLDSNNGKIVMNYLKSLAKEKEKSVIIVTHDARIKDYADRVLWLEDGKIGLRWFKGEKVDPVCFMVVDNLNSSFKSLNDSNVYYFCSEKCKKRFDSNPTFFIKNI